ncbi:MAG: radical SAM protein [Clostridium sartagoforme]|nr:radical SAM protein [Clostridium sartagoforme]
MKIIAYFLPQFHRIAENDKWWGEGFTEWTNTKKAKSFFDGHYQPREPYNDFYYDLTNQDVRRWQIDIAKKHNIYGFCYYHYWLNGKQLLEKPVNDLLSMRELDMPFCICWANHTWNRSWNHEEKEILILQTYGNEQEWEDHFNYLLKIFTDSRYIKIDNKPLFVIYRPSDITNCKERLEYYNRRAQENGFDGIYFVETLHMDDPVYGCGIDTFNAAVEFEPMYTIKQPFSNIMNYDKLWKDILNRERPSNKKYFLGGFTGWDNTARKKEKGLIVLGSTPKKFGYYMKKQIQKAKEINSEFIFVNAWNEWAEGAYLEPDKKYAYGYLENLKESIEKAEMISQDNINEGIDIDTLDEFDKKIINNISSGAERILHVNCGEGILGQAIKKCTESAVYGICKSPDETQKAENNLDFVTNIDATQGKLIYLGKNYDHIIIEDVFEKLDDPWNYIKEINNYLCEDGSIFIKIPNIGNAKVLIDLIFNAKWENLNNINHDNLRFYTLIDFKEIINSQGYKVKNIWRKYISLTEEEEKFLSKVNESKAGLQIWNQDWKVEAKTEQYLIEIIRKESNEHIESIDEVIEKEYTGLKIEIKNNIRSMIESGNLETAKVIIEECKEMLNGDSEFISMKAVIEIMEENYSYAEELIIESLRVFQNNFDLNYNLAYIYEKQKKYELAFDYYNRALKLTENKEEIDIVKNSIREIEGMVDLSKIPYKELVFELTGYCNARCKYCATGNINRTKNNCNEKKYINIDKFKEAITYLLHNNIINQNTFIHLYNYGEPFLNPDILEIYKYLEECGFSYGISTNGSVPRYIDKPLKLKGLKALKFSMPGFSQESYNRMHGFNFEIIKKNIINIVKNYRDNGFEGTIILGFHVYQYNLKEIKEAVEFAKQYDMQIELCNAYFASYTMFRDYIKSNLSYDYLKEVGQELILQYLNNGEVPKFECPHHRDIITIDEECNVLTCCVVDKECNNYYIGNLFKLKVEEIKKMKESQSICEECLDLGIGYYSHNPIMYNKDIFNKN